jgi:hypothetical protein
MGNKNIEIVGESKQLALREISDRFGVTDTVKTLQRMMTEVTKDKVTAETVNAACNCVQNLNLTIKTAIQAAKFLSDKQ